jgi:hypothetical protein
MKHDSNGKCIQAFEFHITVLQCIGATTIVEHRKHIEKDKALARRFQPVMVDEPSQVHTLSLDLFVACL